MAHEELFARRHPQQPEKILCGRPGCYEPIAGAIDRDGGSRLFAAPGQRPGEDGVWRFGRYNEERLRHARRDPLGRAIGQPKLKGKAFKTKQDDEDQWGDRSVDQPDRDKPPEIGQPKLKGKTFKTKLDDERQWGKGSVNHPYRDEPPEPGHPSAWILYFPARFLCPKCHHVSVVDKVRLGVIDASDWSSRLSAGSATDRENK